MLWSLTFIALVLCLVPSGLAVPVELETRAFCKNQINEELFTLLKTSEGRRSTPYPDGQFWAVGYGHQCRKSDCSDLPKGYSIPLSPAESERLFMRDIKKVRPWLSVAHSFHCWQRRLSFATESGKPTCSSSKVARQAEPVAVRSTCLVGL
jgi:GH24 family phage-related lysozyme (muramidase)